MFKLLAKDGNARLGRLETPHGAVLTPGYVMVATDGKVRCLEADDLKETGTQIIIANTYHLWRTLGEEGLAVFPGLREEFGWRGPTMTDSGGFQVFSLGFGREFGVGKVGSKVTHNEAPTAPRVGENLVRVTDSGVYFKEGGEEIYLDAELSMRIQEQLGADIVLAFDEPNSPMHDRNYTEIAMARTHAWAKRSLEAKTSAQMIYGIVQGGLFEDLRAASAKFIGALPFDGFAIGGAFGSSFGDTKENTFRALTWTNPLLPEEKPRHLLGIGRIEDVLHAVELGVDTFDCVIPTREARHGSVWTRFGRFEIAKGKYRNDARPIDEECGCPACAGGISRSDICEFFRTKNEEAGRLATLHNVYFFNRFMEEIRQAIEERRFGDFKKSALLDIRGGGRDD